MGYTGRSTLPGSPIRQFELDSPVSLQRFRRDRFLFGREGNILMLR